MSTCQCSDNSIGLYSSLVNSNPISSHATFDARVEVDVDQKQGLRGHKCFSRKKNKIEEGSISVSGSLKINFTKMKVQ